MAAGTYVDPNMFSVVDANTFKITLPAKNKLALPDLAVPVPDIVNKKLALQHATDKDPWALDWTREHDAGGGPYKVATWKPGDQIVFERFDAWKSGETPKIKRVVYREIESAGTRRALLEKGDVDVSVGLPPKDYAELAAAGKVNVIGTLMQNEMFHVDMNVTMKPFDDKRVRQAIAYALALRGDHETGALRSRRADVGRRRLERLSAGLADRLALQDRSRQGEGAADGSRPRKGLLDRTVHRHEPEHDAGADGAADPGATEETQHRGEDHQDPGLRMVRQDGLEVHADGHQLFLRLAGLSRIFLLLDL